MTIAQALADTELADIRALLASVDAPLAGVPDSQPRRLLHELLDLNGSTAVVTAKLCALLLGPMVPFALLAAATWGVRIG